MLRVWEHSQTQRAARCLMLALADYFYCTGAGITPQVPEREGLADVLRTLEHIHRIEVLEPRGWVAPPVLADELPGWLLAHAERQVLPKAPPEGWPI